MHLASRVLTLMQEQCLEQATSEMGCGSLTGSCRCEHKTLVLASSCSDSNCTMADTLRTYSVFITPRKGTLRLMHHTRTIQITSRCL